MENKNSNDSKEFGKIFNLFDEVEKLKKELNEVKNYKEDTQKFIQIVTKILLDNNLINQDSIEFSQLQKLGGQDYGNTQSGVFAGLGDGVSTVAVLGFDALNSKQNSSSNGRNVKRNPDLLTRLLALAGETEKNGKGNTNDREGNTPLHRGSAESQESGAMGRGTRAISRQSRSVRNVYNYKNQLTKDELKECYENLQRAKKRQLTKKYLNLETKLNERLSNLIDKKSVYDLSTLSKKIAKQLLFIENLGYEVSPNNAKRSIEILKQCSQGLKR